MTIEDVYEDYKEYAHELGFPCRLKSRNYGRDDKTKYCYATFTFSKEGYRKGSACDPRNEDTRDMCLNDAKGKKHSKYRRETRTGCGAKAIFHYFPEANKYLLNEIVEEHNHELHAPKDKSRLQSN